MVQIIIVKKVNIKLKMLVVLVKDMYIKYRC